MHSKVCICIAYLDMWLCEGFCCPQTWRCRHMHSKIYIHWPTHQTGQHFENVVFTKEFPLFFALRKKTKTKRVSKFAYQLFGKISPHPSLSRSTILFKKLFLNDSKRGAGRFFCKAKYRKPMNPLEFSMPYRNFIHLKMSFPVSCVY